MFNQMIVAGILILGTAAAQAQELAPMEGRSVTLGALQGIAYYTTQPEGDRVVATLADPDKGTPFQVIATLAPNQRLELSVPRAAGQPAIAVVFERRGEHVYMENNETRLTN